MWVSVAVLRPVNQYDYIRAMVSVQPIVNNNNPTTIILSNNDNGIYTNNKVMV